MQAKTQTRKPANKPASVKPANKPAKPASKAGQVPAKVEPQQAQQAPVKPVFALVAGAIVQIMHKGLKQAITYHVAKGNIEKVDAGHRLTQQGALLWAKERIEADPARFHEIAAFVHGGECPKEWKGQPTTVAAGTLKGVSLAFPNVLYWGSFAGADMRKAFAALWASRK